MLYRLIFCIWLIMAPSYAATLTLTFESLPEEEILIDQFVSLGVQVSGNPVVLTAGSLLNEFDFPPKSGNNVLADLGGPVRFTFLTPVHSVRAYFSYVSPLTLAIFTSSNVLINSRTSSASSLLGTHEILGFDSGVRIGSFEITGAPTGASFTVDDLRFGDVPEPQSFVPMILACAFGLALRHRNFHR